MAPTSPPCDPDGWERHPNYYAGRPIIPGTGIPAWIVANLVCLAKQSLRFSRPTPQSLPQF
jgi:hypothetical protein